MPILGVTYWTFRLMAGVGVLLLLIPLIGLLLMRRKALERSRRFLWVCVGGRGPAGDREPDAAGSSPRWAASRGSSTAC